MSHQARRIPPLPVAAQGTPADPDAVGDLFRPPGWRHRGPWVPPSNGLAIRYLRRPAAPVDTSGRGERATRGAEHLAPASARRWVGAETGHRGTRGPACRRTGASAGAPDSGKVAIGCAERPSDADER